MIVEDENSCGVWYGGLEVVVCRCDVGMLGGGCGVLCVEMEKGEKVSETAHRSRYLASR